MENELMHWGVKGMRWGIRRYQNKDGSLTQAGKKRYDKEMGKLKAEEKILKKRQRTQDKLNKLEVKRKEVKALREGKTISKEPEKKPAKRSIKDLSDDELRAVVNRLTLEQQYERLKPEQVSKGKKFADAVLYKVIAPAATEVGKNVVKAALAKAVKTTLPDDSHDKEKN